MSPHVELKFDLVNKKSIITIKIGQDFLDMQYVFSLCSLFREAITRIYIE